MNAPRVKTAKLLDEVITAHKRFVSFPNDPRSVTRALRGVGEAAEVDRAYIFQLRAREDATLLASQRFEWSARTAEPQMDNPDLQDIPLREAGYGRWLDRFLAYQPVYGSVASFPEPERRLLQEQEIASLLVLPIYIDAVLWGFIGFDDCSTERIWGDAEVDLLLSLAISLGPILAPRRGGEPAGEAPAGSTNSLITGYAAIAGGLLWPEESTDPADLVEAFSSRLVEARIRSLVRTHRYLRSRTACDAVALERYLVELEDHFNLITRDRGVTTAVIPAIDSGVTVVPQTIPPLGMLVSERLGAIQIDERPDLHHITVWADRGPGHADVVLSGYDASSRPVPVPYRPHASSLLFERRLRSRLGTDSGPGPDDGFVVARVRRADA